jgi:hypothetical protein
VHVRAEARIVGEIPAGMVRVLIDDDRVRTPEPVLAIRDVLWSNAPVVIGKPEALWSAAGQMPDVLRTEPAGEVAMFPGMVQVITGVVPALIVPDPLAVRMHVWGIGMTRLIAVMPVETPVRCRSRAHIVHLRRWGVLLSNLLRCAMLLLKLLRCAMSPAIMLIAVRSTNLLRAALMRRGATWGNVASANVPTALALPWVSARVPALVLLR